jgi:Protein of unknown function (DUF4019)
MIVLKVPRNDRGYDSCHIEMGLLYTLGPLRLYGDQRIEENFMNRMGLVTLLTVMLASPFQLIILQADEGAEKTAAQKATQAWLALVDAAKYSESWEEASELFRKQVTKEQWAKAVEAIRSPLGQLNSRKLTSAEYSKTLAGAPDGDYVTIQFQSSFVNKKSAVETLVSMKVKDGQWRVSGYFIR